jgi:mannose-6-phosphate isomerase-like protein (cupin superfamily)
MKSLPVAVLAFALGLTVASAQSGTSPAGFHLWKAADLAARGAQLATRLDATKLASEALGTEGNRSFLVAHREATGQVEVHDRQADVMFIQSGRLTLAYGGTVVDGKTTAPGETRGASIRGGTEVKLGPGDILHIPAKVPHQMMLAPGEKVTYFVVKVVE